MVVLVVAGLLSTGALLLTLQALLGGNAIASSGIEITSGPSGTQSNSDATFAFDISDGTGTFECSLDGGAYQACTSPMSYSGLDNGLHTFDVRNTPADETVEPASTERQWTVANYLACTGPDQPANFPVYSLGLSVDGFDLTSVTRRCDEPQPDLPGRANYVTYAYGICPELAAGTADTCAPPVAVQTWPGCERSLADYELLPGVPYPHEKLGKLGGASAYSFDEGTRLELYAGDATIVIFASDPTLIDDAVEAIQREPADQPPGQPATAADQGAPLPAPEPGATSGKLSCN
jgi:hypothetical protein